MRAPALALLLVIAACGADEGGKTPDAGVDGRPPDAGVPLCNVTVSVTPPTPVAPVTLVAAASVNTPGFVTMRWRIVGPQGGELPFTEQDTLRVQFLASEAGPYTVGGTSLVGGVACPVRAAMVNVRAANNRSIDVRLRYSPLPTHGVPPQVDPMLVKVPGGGDYVLPAPRVLDGGNAVVGHVTGPSGGLPAYLRLDGGSAGVYELYADGAGAYSGRIPGATFDVLVVPFGASVPAARFDAVSAQALESGFSLQAGDTLTGVVRNGSGEGVPGARLAVATGSLPPVVVATDGDGAFTARVRASAGALSLSVIPPAPGARVTASAGLTVASGDTLVIRLPQVDTVEVAPILRTADGGAAAGARATFVAAQVTPSGSVQIGSASPVSAPASSRAVLVAGAGGATVPLFLPRAIYEVVVDPPPGSSDVPLSSTIDLMASPPPAALASGGSAMTRLTVVDPTAAPVANATVTAVARGLRGVGAGQAASGTSSAAGVALLSLAPGMTYDVVVDPPSDRRLARARGVVVGGTAQASVSLPAGLYLRGTIVFPSGSGQAGVRIEAFCVSCADPALPAAESATGEAGQFELRLPDPGVGP